MSPATINLRKPPPTPYQVSETWNLPLISKERIIELLLSVPLHKATGNDNVSAKLLGIVAPAIADSLCKLISYCIDTQINHLQPSDNSSRNLNNRASNAIIYSRSELLQLRLRQFKIPDETFHLLKRNGILRTQGVHFGQAFRNRTHNIVISHVQQRPDNTKPGKRGVNLHNLCSIKRIKENKQPSKVPGGLEILHLNIRSLKNRSHLLDLRKLASERKATLLLSLKHGSIPQSLKIQIEGYKLHRLDWLHKGGSGVCAYVRKDLKSSVLKELSSISERNFHQLWINVQCKKLKSTIICMTYRPDDSPLSSFEEVLKPSYIRALLLDKSITILGDLNCDGLQKTGTEYRALEKFYMDMNLKELITKPTRITVTT